MLKILLDSKDEGLIRWVEPDFGGQSTLIGAVFIFISILPLSFLLLDSAYRLLQIPVNTTKLNNAK
jgi:hypothetical protein